VGMRMSKRQSWKGAIRRSRHRRARSFRHQTQTLTRGVNNKMNSGPEFREVPLRHVQACVPKAAQTRALRRKSWSSSRHCWRIRLRELPYYCILGLALVLHRMVPSRDHARKQARKFRVRRWATEFRTTLHAAVLTSDLG
jgi:hypothetical protein